MNAHLPSIMLIDDNPDDNFIHERVIRKTGAAGQVAVFESASEALANLRTDGERALPDIIFLDINMPGMNGWDFLDAFRAWRGETGHELVVVMLTTSEDSRDIRRAQQTGLLLDFQVKPLTSASLSRVIELYTARRAGSGG